MEHQRSPGDRDPDTAEQLSEADSALRQVRSTPFENELAEYIRTRFRDAASARCACGVEEEMFRSAYAYAGEYTPDEMAKLEPGTHAYMPITQVKCRGMQNWLTDVMQNAVDRPFTLSPTPVMDVPEHLEDVAVERLSQLFASGRIDVEEMQEMVEEARSIALDQARSSAQTASERMADKIQDQLLEGGWRDVYDQFVVDLSVMPVGVLRGPVVASKMRISNNNGAPREIEEDVFEFWRVNPFDFFPAPRAESVEKAAYIIERMYMTQDDLVRLKRSAGAQPEIIAALIARYPDGYEGCDGEDYVGNAGKEKFASFTNTNTSGPDKTFTVLCYVGDIPVRMAMEYGLMKEVDDHQDFVRVEVWTAGEYILRAITNPYPLGRKPYYAAGFQRQPGSIWFKSLPAVIRDTQRICNASVRALVKNMAFSAGPIGEVNVENLVGEDNIEQVEPYRLYKVAVDALTQNPSGTFRFTTIPSTSPHLLRVYNQFKVEADDISGIPAYVVGNPDVGGAGRTLGGLSMLMGNAAKGIKRVVSISDNLILEPIVSIMYAINMLYSDDDTIKADAQVIARGASGLLQKELSQSRAIELLQVLVQPIVAQSGYVPPETIPRLLRDVAAGMGYDPDIIPDPNAERDVFDLLQTSGFIAPSATPPSVVSPANGQQALSGLDGRSQAPPAPPGAQPVPAA